jgi:hypothetical protein
VILKICNLANYHKFLFYVTFEPIKNYK